MERSGMSVILMYHSISGTIDDGNIQVRPATLARQLRWVKEEGYRWGNLDDALRCPHEKIAAVTFDDGFADFLEAVDTLRTLSVPATLFICPGLVGQTAGWATTPAIRSRPLLGIDELKSLVAQGIELGCHGRTHRAFPALPSAELANDLKTCADWFGAVFGDTPQTLAYPFGQCDPVCAEIVARKYEFALAVDPVEHVPTRLAVPRMPVSEAASREQFCRQMGQFELSGTLGRIAERNAAPPQRHQS